jgi:hypothetical protein
VRTMLGLEPDQGQWRIMASPVLPGIVSRIEMRSVWACGNRYNIVATDEHNEVTEVLLEGEQVSTNEKAYRATAKGTAGKRSQA